MTPGGWCGPRVQSGLCFASSSAHRSGPVINPVHRPVCRRPGGCQKLQNEFGSVLSPGGRRLVCSVIGDEGHHGRTGELKKVWDDDSARAMWVAFSPDGKTLVSQSSDKTVKVWDVETAKVSRTLQGNKAWIIAVAFSPDGDFFATGGIVREKDTVTGGEVILWNAQTGDLKHTLPDLTVPVSTLSFSPDGKTLAIAGGSGGDLNLRGQNDERNQTLPAGVADEKKVAEEYSDLRPVEVPQTASDPFSRREAGKTLWKCLNSASNRHLLASN